MRPARTIASRTDCGDATGTVSTALQIRRPNRASARSRRWRRMSAATSLAECWPERTSTAASSPGCALMRKAEDASSRRAEGESAERPIRRLTPKTVLSGSEERSRSASAPTRVGPLRGKWTTLGTQASPRASSTKCSRPSIAAAAVE